MLALIRFFAHASQVSPAVVLMDSNTSNQESCRRQSVQGLGGADPTTVVHREWLQLLRPSALGLSLQRLRRGALPQVTMIPGMMSVTTGMMKIGTKKPKKKKNWNTIP
jgi:hypothetical protein